MFELMKDLLEWLGLVPIVEMDHRAPDAPPTEMTGSSNDPPEDEGPDAGSIIDPYG